MTIRPIGLKPSVVARLRGRSTAKHCAAPAVMLGLTLSLIAPAHSQTPAIAAFRLLHPADVEEVSLSPSGNRLAALTINPAGNGLIVMEWRQGQLAPVLGNSLGQSRSFTRYQWLTDDYLLLPYHDYRSNFDQSVLADIRKHAAHYLNSYVDVIKAPWGDAGHVLISGTGNDCASAVAARCLLSLQLAGGTTHKISDGLTETPVDYLAVSPSEIYATGRDGGGHQHDYQLNLTTGAWRPLPDGSVERQRELHRADEKAPAKPTDEMLAQAVRAGIHLWTPIYSQPSGQVAALLGHAPEPALVAVNSSLDGIEALLKGPLAGERASLSGLSDDASHGLLTVSAPDHPPRYLFLTDTGLHEYAPLAVQIDISRLGRTHIERGWVDGVPVSVTLPPADVPLIGAVVDPFTAQRFGAEDPLAIYDGQAEVMALRGIAFVKVLATLPDSFPDPAAGGAWRQALRTTLETVLSHVSGDLLKGKDACLYGNNADGELSLALGALPHVGCVIAIDPHLAGGANRATQVMTGDIDQTLTYTASAQELHREVPAVFGSAQTDSLVDAMSWVPALPSHVMLAFDTADQLESTLAAESAGFRGAAQHAGKQVAYFARQTVGATPDAEFAAAVDAAAAYAMQFFTNSSSVASR